MCGICGIIRFNEKTPLRSEVEGMMAAIKHRGPNDEGLYTDGAVGLGFRRLSIIDLSPLGHQPMISSDERYAIIFNGEVYNYIEIRRELLAKGYTFRSQTDTEVVLNAFIEWGPSCLERFNGMWALVIYDKTRQELFCARDRFGVKPFYFYLDHEKLAFASEIQALFSVLQRKPTVNEQVLFDYMVYNRTDQSEQTFFKEIRKLPHAHSMQVKIKERKVDIRRWYDLKERLKIIPSFPDPEAFKETFRSAIALRLRSDVPVGVCLSGGLDSSSIVSVLLKHFQRTDLNTFSAVYEPGDKGDESEFINEYRSELRNMHFVTPTGDLFYKDLPKFICTHAEPFPTTSIYAHYKVMELARDYVVVTLDGQGADEEMAGYHYFFGFYYKQLIRRLRLVKLVQELGSYWKHHRSGYALKSMLFFLAPGNVRSGLRVNEKGYLTGDFAKSGGRSLISNELYGSHDLNEALFNHFEYKLEHLLKWQDLNSMRFSIEARVPFLDYRVVEGLLTVEPDKIINKGMTKQYLRKAMEGILPEKIRMRKDKVGFETPQGNWFRQKNFQEMIQDILHSSSFRNRNIVDAKKANQLYQEHLAGKIDISKEIWKWINLELWFRRYVDD